jgi:predicted CoA-binding protein
MKLSTAQSTALPIPSLDRRRWKNTCASKHVSRTYRIPQLRTYKIKWTKNTKYWRRGSMHNLQALAQRPADSLSDIFDSKSVAVVGASADPGKAGYQVLKTLLTMGYQGQVFAVNPKEREILGVACHASILDIPSRLDLLVISLPAPHVLATMRQAVQRGDIRAAVVLSAGFSETAVPEWVEAERELVRIAESSASSAQTA